MEGVAYLTNPGGETLMQGLREVLGVFVMGLLLVGHFLILGEFWGRCPVEEVPRRGSAPSIFRRAGGDQNAILAQQSLPVARDASSLCSTESLLGAP